MSLSGVLSKQVSVKLDGDVFHELFRYKPHHTSEMSSLINGVDLHDGEWGAVGSIVVWRFILDGDDKVYKDLVEAIDEEKKLVCLKVMEGDILDSYKNFSITVHVDTDGEENLVTWTFHYEKLNESIDDPVNLMDACINFTKDVEKYHLAKSN